MRALILAMGLCLAATQAEAQSERLYSQVDIANRTLADATFLEAVSNAMIGSTMTWNYMADFIDLRLVCPNDFTFREGARLYATEVLRRSRTEPYLKTEKAHGSNALGHFAYMATTELCSAEPK